MCCIDCSIYGTAILLYIAVFLYTYIFFFFFSIFLSQYYYYLFFIIISSSSINSSIRHIINNNILILVHFLLHVFFLYYCWSYKKTDLFDSMCLYVIWKHVPSHTSFLNTVNKKTAYLNCVTNGRHAVIHTSRLKSVGQFAHGTVRKLPNTWGKKTSCRVSDVTFRLACIFRTIRAPLVSWRKWRWVREATCRYLVMSEIFQPCDTGV